MSSLQFERDRFVAFAFAAADVLIETDDAGKVVFAAGAIRSVAGCEREALIGTLLIDHIDPADRRAVAHYLGRVEGRGRLEPIMAHILQHSGGRVRVILGGCALPDLGRRKFVTLTLQPLGLAPGIGRPRDSATGLLLKDDLIALANQASHVRDGRQHKLTLVQLSGLEEPAGIPPGQESSEVLQEIGAVLRSHSVGGDAAGRLGDDTFGLIQAGNDDVGLIAGEIRTLPAVRSLKAASVGASVASIELDAGMFDERDTAKALAYAVRKFSERNGEDFNIPTMAVGVTAMLAETVPKVSALRESFDASLTLAFQPIVGLADGRVHHHEVLARFRRGESPYEMIRFGEEVGLAQHFDLRIIERVLGDLRRLGDDINLAVNLSGRSCQSASFRDQLLALLQTVRIRPERLLFEITETSTITDTGEAVRLLHALKELRHPMCLDDFGAGAVAYTYFRHFEVDFVKIDGQFLKHAFKNRRDQALVRSIAHLCQEVGCRTIGEMIETREEAAAAARLGIGFGQGFLYGRPAPEPAPVHMAATARSSPQRPARRKGNIARWE